MVLNFTRQQWLVTATFVVVNFCNAMVVSMQVRLSIKIKKADTFSVFTNSKIKICCIFGKNYRVRQAPFYPHEAEKKGCVPSEYGLVFGIFELTVFLVSPIIGANLNRMGMKVYF